MLRWIAGFLVGCVTWAAVAALGFATLRHVWADYALAEPQKAYTLAMLFARLTVGVICTAAGGALGTLTAGGDHRVAWALGFLFLALSLPIHLGRVWDDYPAWYHFAYLIPLAPIAGYGGWFVRRAPASS
jgi:hypothetical protein